jgi:hypothetical protein
MGRAIACTIQLGSISSLRCQKSRTRVRQDNACEVMFSRTIYFGSAVGPSSLFRATPGTLRLRPGGCSSSARWLLVFGPVAAPRVAEGEAWWSQTGSNRRPHACKARALPAELWPHFLRRRPSSPHSASKTRVDALCRARFTLLSCMAAPRVANGEAWWAWEDLNFRPHAYQARALTN